MEVVDKKPRFRATWHSSARCTCNLEGSGALRRIRFRVTQLHIQRCYH
ncbi:unnamed protein product [Schistosoma margrebowiei]|uniref:Uncharacterized protein n=1 Tax=Schistosoma margrebowiei TaxID=48269 RepID=A0A3P8CIG7_9TREM|nr:unnamed protein product [Schistosoma margrebowiei]